MCSSECVCSFYRKPISCEVFSCESSRSRDECFMIFSFVKKLNSNTHTEIFGYYCFSCFWPSFLAVMITSGNVVAWSQTSESSFQTDGVVPTDSLQNPLSSVGRMKNGNIILLHRKPTTCMNKSD